MEKFNTPMYSLQDVLMRNDNVVYRVPRFQREYEWGKDNWRDLLDDFRALEDDDSPHYLGSILLVGKYDDNGTLKEYEVIDGQQRLTTVSVLVAALLDKIADQSNDLTASEQDGSAICDRAKDCLVLQSDKEKTRLELQEQNRNGEDYRWIMSKYTGRERLMSKPDYFGNRRLGRLQRYYSEQLDAEMETVDSSVTLLEKLLGRVLSSTFVVIEADSQADAYKLFSTLNDRGLALTSLDLIKNLLFSRLHDEGQNIEEVYKKWQGILNNLGDDNRVHERFLRHTYNAFRDELNEPFVDESAAAKGVVYPLGAFAKSSNLVDIYEKLIKQNAGEILKLLEECSVLYSQIIGLNDGGKESEELPRAFVDLAHAKGAPSYLLLLYLMRMRNRKDGVYELSDKTVVSIIRLLIHFTIRRNLTDEPPTRDLDRLFIGICEGLGEKAMANGSMEDEQVLSFVKEAVLDKSASDDRFKEKLRGAVYEESSTATKFLLVSLVEETRETPDFWELDKKGKPIWSIEHIFPQGPNIPDCWVKMIAGGNLDDAKDIQAQYVHQVGNLTLTAYNSKLSNLSFENKRDRKDDKGRFIGYKNGLSLNDDLKDKDVWTKEDIEKRTEDLADRAFKLFSFEEPDD